MTSKTNLVQILDEGFLMRVKDDLPYGALPVAAANQGQ
jgi:hypothetical protein